MILVTSTHTSIDVPYLSYGNWSLGYPALPDYNKSVHSFTAGLLTNSCKDINQAMTY